MTTFTNFNYGPVKMLAQGFSAQPQADVGFSKLSGDVSSPLSS